jgi:serine/threonine protein kinase
MSRTQLTTVEGLSLSAAPSLVVQSFDDVLQRVQKLGLRRCKFEEIEHEARVGEGESFRVERCRYNNKVMTVKHIKLASSQADSQNSYRRLRIVLTELLIMYHAPLREHPNVLSVFGYGWKPYGQSLLPYIVVEYCEHGSLMTWLSNSTKDITTKLILAEMSLLELQHFTYVTLSTET